MEAIEFPDVYDLFQTYNVQFFEDKLGAVQLTWSKRMTLCAGICEKKQGLITIKLSEPLLKYRTASDVKETLLHEMIHAYLWVLNIPSGRDGHGPEFLSVMFYVNQKTKLNVTVRHNFSDEVDYYRKHVWRCDGVCKDWKPFFGYVKRAMNRAPSSRDHWCK